MDYGIIRFQVVYRHLNVSVEVKGPVPCVSFCVGYGIGYIAVFWLIEKKKMEPVGCCVVLFFPSHTPFLFLCQSGCTECQ